MNLKEWLDDRGMSAAEFARRSKVDRCTVHLWIYKKRSPSYKNFKRIEEITEGKVTYEEMQSQIQS